MPTVTKKPSPHAPSPGLGTLVPRTFQSPTRGPALAGITDLLSFLSSTTSPSTSSHPLGKSGHQAEATAQAAIIQPTQDLVLPQLEVIAADPRVAATAVTEATMVTAVAMATVVVMVTAAAMVTAVAMVSAAVMATAPIRIHFSFSSPLMEPSVSFKMATLFLSPPTRLVRATAPVSLSAMEL